MGQIGYPITLKFSVKLPFSAEYAPLDLNSPDVTLGIRLKHLRRRLGVTIVQLATQAGVSPGTITRLERDRIRDLKLSLVGKILSALGSRIKSITPNETKDIYDWIVPPSNVGNWLRNIRLRHGLSQKELARTLKITRMSIYRYEQNLSKPNNEIRSRIKSLFKTTEPVRQQESDGRSGHESSVKR